MPGSDFCFGEKPGLADIALVPQVFTAEALGIPVADFPRVAGVFRRCMELEAFSRNSPQALRPVSAG
jgi:glutathione S-transferase